MATTDEEIIRLLKHDFSAGREDAKERILRECLAIIAEEEKGRQAPLQDEHFDDGQGDDPIGA